MSNIEAPAGRENPLPADIWKAKETSIQYLRYKKMLGVMPDYRHHPLPLAGTLKTQPQNALDHSLTVTKRRDRQTNGKADFTKLMRDCHPDSSGLKAEDVMGESDLKVVKLDRSVLSSDFCPCELEIIDTIVKVLLPGNDKRGCHR